MREFQDIGALQSSSLCESLELTASSTRTGAIARSQNLASALAQMLHVSH